MLIWNRRCYHNFCVFVPPRGLAGGWCRLEAAESSAWFNHTNLIFISLGVIPEEYDAFRPSRSEESPARSITDIASKRRENWSCPPHGFFGPTKTVELGGLSGASAIEKNSSSCGGSMAVPESMACACPRW